MDPISGLVKKYYIPQQGQYIAASVLMNLNLIGNRRQWLSDSFDKCGYWNPLTFQHNLRVIWNLNSKHFSTHICLSSFTRPNHCLTLDGQPHDNFHILQCDLHLTMWQVECMGFRAPLLYKCSDQCMVKLYGWGQVQTLQTKQSSMPGGPCKYYNNR